MLHRRAVLAHVTVALLAAVFPLSGCGMGRAAEDPSVLPAARPGSRIRLRNVAQEQGLNFRWVQGGKSPLTSLDSIGCGCAFWDFDQDGWLDILLIGEPYCGLFRNTGNGRFEDVSSAVGLNAVTGPWKGCAVGDTDGDGWSDLLLTGYHRTVLLRNHTGKKLVDVTTASGIDNKEWATSAGFSDLDADGDLDLYIANYVVFGPQEQQHCELAPGVLSSCPPRVYRPERGRLFLNEGHGKFRDVSKESGVLRTDGKSLVVGFCDYDDDGRIDFYVGNDGTPADLFRNQGKMRFENVGLRTGIALSSQGGALAAMGIDWADVDRNGSFDAAVSAFSNEPFALYRQAHGLFSEDSGVVGIAGPTYKPLGFGTRFVDLDNDGLQDLVFSCGHVYETTHLIDAETTYRQPMMVFQGQADGAFVDVTSQTGGDCTAPIVGRGMAAGDYDRDGRTDLLVVDYEGEPLLLHNETVSAGGWLDVAAEGPSGNPFGYGCRIQVTTDGAAAPLKYQLTPVSSYLSSSEPVVHVSTGSERIVALEVRWPDGKAQRITSPTPKRRMVVRYEDAR